ncbi:probable inactive receptor kinase At4g23740 [Papaver somniferum]|uniref:probable inactive receptor kinase At4g23740 n=1 Tax=Papaver somniferum TaxID=3469 RepID=UPI000E6FD286|nr:probable inactive receptor kinase At4g23740 [Papaver somniferum]
MMLIQRCSEVQQSWNCKVKKRYSNDIRRLDKRLVDFLTINVQAHMWSDVKHIKQAVDRLVKGGTSGGPVAEANLNTSSISTAVCLEVPRSCTSHRDEKLEMNQFSFRDDVSVGKFLAPKGIGRTTLSENFDLKVVQEAAFEILGKGVFGETTTLYHADHQVVLKASIKDPKVHKEVAKARRQVFQELIDIVCRIKHANVVPLRAYYYSQEEKIFVYDFYSQGSVYSMLHDWEARVKIAIGVAKGIACIHSQNNGKLVHGNIKSSNIFLNAENYGCISDLGQCSWFTPMFKVNHEAHGHIAPEMDFYPNLSSQPADIYSYGCFLAELVSGELGSPTLVNLLRKKYVNTLEDRLERQFIGKKAQWKEMLRIASDCTSNSPQKRPRIHEVLIRVKGITEKYPQKRPQIQDAPMRVKCIRFFGTKDYLGTAKSA